MFSSFLERCAVLLAVLCSSIVLVEGTREFSQRRDLQDVPPVSASGYTVPLQEGETCNKLQVCTNMLSAPPNGSKLQYLAIARGYITYSCADRSPTQAPVYVSQDTSLYDAAPLIATFSDETQFHQIIPYFLEFDYTALKNSTLSCIGNIDTYQGSNVIDLFSIDVFPVDIQQTVKAPVKPNYNLEWAHSTSNDKRWDIYRVETAGGEPPQNCHEQNDLIELDYAAEYWFYR